MRTNEIKSLLTKFYYNNEHLYFQTRWRACQGARPRRGQRAAGRAGAHQPRGGRGQLLQEALAGGEPALRRPRGR